MMEYIEKEGTRLCHRLVEYSKKWNQPIKVQKTVGQLLSTQKEQSKIELHMAEQTLNMTNKLNYLGFTWTSKLLLKPTTDHCLDKF